MFKKSDPIEAAIAVAEKARGVLQTLDQKTAASQAALEAAAAAAADEALAAIEGGGDVPVSKQTLRLSTELDALRRARPTAAAKVVDAVRGIYASGALIERAEAARLRSQAQGIVDASRAPLQKLTELEGVRFDRSILLCQRAGAWYTGRGLVAAGENDGPLGAAPDPTNPMLHHVPMSVILQRDADKHEAAAQQLEEKATNISGGDVDELLKQAVAAVRPAESAEQAA